MMEDMLVKIDIQLLRLINDQAGMFSLLDQLMVLVSDTVFWTCVFLALLVFSFAKRVRYPGLLLAIIFGLLCLGAADLISFEVVKQYFKRERPCWALEDVKMILGRCGGSYGFTSNHAANAGAFVTAIFLTYAFPAGIRWIAIVLAFAVCISRVFLGVHYPADVIGGFVLGCGISFVLYKVGIFGLLRRLETRA
ncbi:MAG: phosphatase PAP2 family protein [Proteobacteria bacterium]|nr:phosphatase PAP2 family protein [Pseudomonadota bacterium]